MSAESQALLASALASNASGAVEGALAASIASSAGLDAAAVAVTRVEEALTGALDFDLGGAAADVAGAFADPATRDDIARSSVTIKKLARDSFCDSKKKKSAA